MKTIRLLSLILFFFSISCNPDEPIVDPGTDLADPTHGRIDFDFILPAVKLPDGKVHRVDLSLAKSLDSLYRKQFCTAANVSDYKQVYSFSLIPGRYFYQAGVTCTCGGDSCLYGGFPGGQLSVWWTSGWVDVEKGKVFSRKLVFQ